MLFKFIKHQLRKIRAVAVVTYKEWSAYRTHSMVSIFVGPVYFLVQYCIWKAVYSAHGGTDAVINGMRLEQMLTYFGVNALIGYLTMDFADWNLQMLVRTGKFLTFALRPIDHKLFAFSQKLGHRVLGFIFEFLPCFLIFMFVFKINLIPEHWVLALISIALGFCMTFLVNYCIGLTAFWIVRAEGIRNVFQALQTVFNGSLIPLVFFGKTWQKVLFFLPFQYMLYVPSRVCTGSYELAGKIYELPQIVGIQACAVCVFLLLTCLLYNRAMKQFTGAGA
ncbi:MAG: ABC-2 family transporter protein [Spirochaetaceae bacterium]|nr:ABC-2 family transporter protein [Spirochaetaceae bacterium]MBP5329499.1 ABC-2 family transporter protein [Spirochaetaceae bacterium]